MNKTILLAASAALIMAGCTKNEMVPAGNDSANGGGEITFTTYTGRTITKAGTDLNQSFNVEAFIAATKTKYFCATNYNYAAGAYTGDSTHYWPLSSNLDFYAVSPLKYKNTSGSNVDLKVSDTTFTVTATNGKTDIVAAKKKNEAKSDSPVALEFGHKLTKVAFKAVGADTTKIYKIDSIVVSANSTATYNYNPTESWSDAGTSYDYIFLGTDKTIPAKTKNATAVGDTLYLIPKQSSVKAKVRYSVYEGATMIDSTATAIEVDLPTTAWGINKSVVYSLTLNFTSSATPITFTATTTDWGAEVKDTVDVPKQVPHYVVGSNDYGEGIEIGGVIWAPVNCGYVPTTGDSGDALGYPYGKLYQWGRKYGQGYYDTCYEDADYPGKPGGNQFLVDSSSSLTSHPDGTTYNGKFYHDSSDNIFNWYSGPEPNKLWNSNEGSSDPVSKSRFDPCPEGWRVPTYDELNALLGGNSSPSIVEVEGQKGCYFNGTSSASSGVFLPAAGYRHWNSGFADYRDVYGPYGDYWSSSVDDESAWALDFNYDGAYMGILCRAGGYSVRCVKE